jgi:hypothetical protein
MSSTTVQQIWAEAGLRPHRVETFKFSTDPELVAKVHDVVGLSLDPPERAIVLSVDEKTQVQALDRTQPMLPLRPGLVESWTHDYKPRLQAERDDEPVRRPQHRGREVTHEARAHHTRADFLAFLRRLDRVNADQELHVIFDNVSTHKTPAVQVWPRRHPTWFSILTRQAIQRGSFGSVKGARLDDQHVHRQLERRIDPLRVDEDRRRDPHQSGPQGSGDQRIATLANSQVACGRPRKPQGGCQQ